MSLTTAPPPPAVRPDLGFVPPLEEAQPPPRDRGQVKWFNDQKGFGFIVDADGRDVFVHYGVIDGGGFKTLDDGETVAYDAVDGPKGRKATRVCRL